MYVFDLPPTPPAPARFFSLLDVTVGGLGVVGVLGEGCAGLELDYLDAEGVSEDLLGGR